MMRSHTNRAIIAAAGSGKTATVIDEALALTSGRVLITTFTNENRRQILARIERLTGTVPSNIDVMGWFSFLVNEGARPYQNVMTGQVGTLGSLNFVGSRYRFTKRTDLAYYLDQHNDIFRDGVSDFVCRADAASGGKVIARLESIYSHIFVDEVQDLVGYDLDVLDLLISSSTSLTLVGDPRQHTFSTNLNSRNKRYRGAGFVDWLSERSSTCKTEVRDRSWRCNQEICDFADALFPHLSPTVSLNKQPVDHRGVFVISRKDVRDYVERWQPAILRDSKRNDTKSLPAINIGVAKGSTFDRVLIFPTRPMLDYVADRNLAKLKTKDRLYVAVTRAKHSVTFVKP